jgi:hypothetical protein
VRRGLIIGAAIAAAAVLVWRAASTVNEAPPAANGTSIPDRPAALAASSSETPSHAVAAIPFADEPGATEDLASSTPAAEFEIRDDRDQPAARARTVLFRGEAPLGRAMSDATGLVRFGARDGDARLLIVAICRPAHVVDVSLAAGRTVVRLPGGATISGRVFVDGVAPRTPVRLRLDDDGRLDAANVPEKVRAVEPQWRFQIEIEAFTAEGGAFEFRGVTTGWTGSVSWGPEYVAVKPSVVSGTARTYAAPASAPSAGLEIDLRTAPALTGRLVEPETRAPIPRGRFAVITGNHRSQTTRESRSADEQGRFRIPVPELMEDPPPTKAVIAVSHSSGVGRKEHVFEGDLSAGHDFGDLSPAAVRTLDLRVRDQAGAPIGGASVSAKATTDRVADLVVCDAEGAAVLVVESGSTLAIGARGFDVAEVATPDQPPTPFVVTLTKGQTVDVRAVLPDGGPAPALKLVVSGGPRLIRGWWGDVTGRLIDPPLPYGPHWTLGESNSTRHLEIGASGRVVTGDLPDGLPAMFELSDELRSFVLSESVTLADGETREIVFKVPVVPRTTIFRATDEAGKPLKHAEIRVQSRDRAVQGYHHFGTDADGRATWTARYAARFRVEAYASGFVPLNLADCAPPADGSPVEFVFAKGRDLAVRVVDPDGGAVPAEQIWVEDVALRIPEDPSELMKGRAALVAVPFAEVILKAKVGDREYSAPCGPRQTEATIVVPKHGVVAARWDVRTDVGRLKDDPINCFIRLEPGDASLPRRLGAAGLRGDLKTRTFVFPAVLPGRYRAHFVYEGFRLAKAVLAAEVDFVVEPGKTTELVFR